jgi:hypothetical protein
LLFRYVVDEGVLRAEGFRCDESVYAGAAEVLRAVQYLVLSVGNDMKSTLGLLFGIGLLLASCAAPKSQLATLWLPEMGSIQHLDFHNDGPEVAVLKTTPPRPIVGPIRVSPGETVRVTYVSGVYKTEILP